MIEIGDWRTASSYHFSFCSRAFYRRSGISKTMPCTPSRCLSCTTRRNERTSRSHNLRLSWLLLCRLCMIFHRVGELRKHGLRKPAKWRTGTIDVGVMLEPLSRRALEKKFYANFPNFYARSRILATKFSVASIRLSDDASWKILNGMTNKTTRWT